MVGHSARVLGRDTELVAGVLLQPRVRIVQDIPVQRLDQTPRALCAAVHADALVCVDLLPIFSRRIIIVRLPCGLHARIIDPRPRYVLRRVRFRIRDAGNREVHMRFRPSRQTIRDVQERAAGERLRGLLLRDGHLLGVQIHVAVEGPVAEAHRVRARAHAIDPSATGHGIGRHPARRVGATVDDVHAYDGLRRVLRDDIGLYAATPAAADDIAGTFNHDKPFLTILGNRREPPHVQAGVSLTVSADACCVSGWRKRQGFPPRRLSSGRRTPRR